MLIFSREKYDAALQDAVDLALISQCSEPSRHGKRVQLCLILKLTVVLSSHYQTLIRYISFCNARNAPLSNVLKFSGLIFQRSNIPNRIVGYIEITNVTVTLFIGSPISVARVK